MISPSLIDRWRTFATPETEVSFDKIKKFKTEIMQTSGKQVKLRTEVLDSPVSVEATMVNHADNEIVDIIVIGTKGKSSLNIITWKCGNMGGHLCDQASVGNKVNLCSNQTLASC